MLAYVFWHRPRAGTDSAAYERAQLAFHRSLARNPPVGMRASAIFRLVECPWLEPQEGADAAGYEDWYLLADFTALGVLNEAAVGRGHRSRHDRAASLFGAGAGGLYGLIEGHAAIGAGTEEATHGNMGPAAARVRGECRSASPSATAWTRGGRACGGARSCSGPHLSTACSRASLRPAWR